MQQVSIQYKKETTLTGLIRKSWLLFSIEVVISNVNL
jgi:hypothetical protein